jgi:hypothetical protein
VPSKAHTQDIEFTTTLTHIIKALKAQATISTKEICWSAALFVFHIRILKNWVIHETAVANILVTVVTQSANNDQSDSQNCHTVDSIDSPTCVICGTKAVPICSHILVIRSDIFDITPQNVFDCASIRSANLHHSDDIV